MGEVSPLNKLYDGYRNKDFEFFTIYVREPHPGENYGPHEDWEQKLQYARDCREQDAIHTTLIVDDIDGTTHCNYGILPNMIYIIDKDGTIVYKAMWTDHSEIETVLANLVLADELRTKGIRVKPSYTEKINYIPAEHAGGLREKVFSRAGQQAWDDYKRTISDKSQTKG